VILHLGVIDIPYEEESVTTGDVAEELEARYGVMQFFFDSHSAEIIKLMENDIAGALENFMAGAPLPSNPFLESMGRVHELFSNFIIMQQMNGQPGVPTLRALEGISRRLKNKKGPPRPSFLDTGLYMASMRAWVTDVINAID